MTALKWLVEVTERRLYSCWYSQICRRESCIYFEFSNKYRNRNTTTENQPQSVATRM